MPKDLTAMTDRLTAATAGHDAGPVPGASDRRKNQPARSAQPARPTRTRDTQTTAADTAGRISLYLPDKTLKKRLRVAALEADTTVSALFTEWAEDWLASQQR